MGSRDDLLGLRKKKRQNKKNKILRTARE